MPDRIDYEALAAMIEGGAEPPDGADDLGEWAARMRAEAASQIRALGRELDAAEREATASDLLSDQYARELSAALRRAEEAERKLAVEIATSDIFRRERDAIEIGRTIALAASGLAIQRAEEAERALFDLMSVIRFSDGQAHLFSWHDWQDWRERHQEMVLRAKETPPMKLYEMPGICMVYTRDGNGDFRRCEATAFGGSPTFGGGVCPAHGGPTREEWEREYGPLPVERFGLQRKEAQ